MSNCILKTTSISGNGYVKRSYKGATWSAHRAAWDEAFGPIPPGMCVLHRCDNRNCVNVDHLFLGTYLDNNRDARTKGRSSIGSRHGQAVLSEQEVLEMREMRQKGFTYKEIASHFGRNLNTTYAAVTKMNWSHV